MNYDHWQIQFQSTLWLATPTNIFLVRR